MIPLGCVTGRFQPVHEQHMALFKIALGECKHLIVALTNPDPGARHQELTSLHRHTAQANPFTYFERVRLIEAALRDADLNERTTMVPFDLTRREVWPQYVPLSAQQYVRAYSDWERQKAHWLEEAGYPVTLLNGDPLDRLSASEIRDSIRAGTRDWQALVPAATATLLDEMLRQAPMGAKI